MESMASRKLTSVEKQARCDHFIEHPDCWCCLWFGLKQSTRTELHHIAGRGKGHECRENYASLCANCHSTLQSRAGAELVCLMLKASYDMGHYDPEKICHLRGRAITCWTHNDVAHTIEVTNLLKELMK